MAFATDDRAAPMTISPVRAPLRGWMMAAVVLASVAAFAMRTATSYAMVFTPTGINFQENDGWYHVRSAQNLAAHFPRRSGFDPYAIFPGGQPLVTGPLWDYMIATPAWILSGGSPSPRAVELVAVWLTPLLGALFPPLVFLLARLLFDDLAGVFAAWWIALLPGPLVWTSRLAGADHHTAESFFALLALGLVCYAAESIPFPIGESRFPIRGRALWFTLAAGVALGAYFANRPAGIFMVGILVLALLLDPVLAPISAVALGIAALLFIPARGSLWSADTWTALGFGIVCGVAVTVAAHFWRVKQWSPVSLLGTEAAALVVAICGAWLVRPTLFTYLLFQFKRAAGLTGTIGVSELKPLLQTTLNMPLSALLAQLGTSWILAFPALAVLIVMNWETALNWTTAINHETRRPALMLFTVWSAVMTAAAFAQVRMTVYLLVNAAILAGWSSAWIWRFSTRPRVRIAAAAFVLLCVAVNASIALDQLDVFMTPSPEWRRALEWLRTQSPEPLGEAAAWTSFYPSLPPDTSFRYPSQAYGVTVWWDFGYWVEYLARRIPSSNGTQAGVVETARFYCETDPDAALRTLDKLGSRYVLVDPKLGGADGGSFFMMIPPWIDKKAAQYEQLVLNQELTLPVRIYLPSYYRTMAMRLYVFDGQPARATGELYAIHTHEVQRGRQAFRAIDFKRRFSTEREAQDFVRGPAQGDFIIGSFDSKESPVPLEAVPELRLAYSSGGDAAVKVFERVK